MVIWLKLACAWLFTLRRAGLVAVAGLAIAFGTMSAVDGLLAQMHVTGERSGKVVDLWFDPLSPSAPDSDRATRIVCGWQAYTVATKGGRAAGECGEQLATGTGEPSNVEPSLPARDPRPDCTKDVVTDCATTNGRHLAHVYLLFDIFLFAPAYTIIIIALWRRLRDPGQAEPSATGVGVRPAVTRFRSSRFVLWAAIGAFVADEIENVVTLGYVNRTWSGASAMPLPFFDTVPIIIIWVAGLLKWVAVAAAILPFAFTAIGWLVDHRKIAIRLAPLVAVAVVPFFALQNAQGADAIRRWEVKQWAATAVLTLLLSLVSGAFAHRIASGLWQAKPLDVAGDKARGWSMIVVGAALVAAGVLWARLGPWFPGLGALVVLFGVGYLLSGPIDISGAGQGSSPQLATDVSPYATAQLAQQGAVHAAALIAAIPVLAVFTPAVEAVAGEAFYSHFASVSHWLLSGYGKAFIRVVLAVAIGTWLVVQGFKRFAPTPAATPTPLRRTVTITAILVVTLPTWLFFAHRRSFQEAASDDLGAVAVVVSFLVVVLVVLWLANIASDWILAIGPPTTPGPHVPPTGSPTTGQLPPPGPSPIFRSLSHESIEADPSPWAFPLVLRIIGWRRPPVVAGLLLWALIAPLADTGTYHEARRSDPTAATGFTLDSYITSWFDRQPDSVTTADAAPIVFVAGSGGGIRAAYWTTAVLDCLVNRNTGDDGRPCSEPATVDERQARLDRLFALSGISGSSYGLVTFAIGAIDSPTRDGPALRPDNSEVWEQPGWYKELLDDDFLAPTLTRWLYNDTPNVWFRQPADDDCSGPERAQCDGDRAVALEQAWERAWDDVTSDSPLTHDFVEWQAKGGPRLPLLLLNSYSVEDGCRFNVSVLESNGIRDAEQCRVFRQDLDGSTDEAPIVLDATTDLLDFTTCPPDDNAQDDRTPTMNDLPISTAALLSARFPFVTPSGKVSGCGIAASYLVDGGYRDTSAASTLVEIWPRVEQQLRRPAADTDRPAIVNLRSIFIQIDNGYDDAGAPPPNERPNELLVPSDGRAKAMGGIANASKQSAERVFDCFVRITTVAHPGSQAPLGWVLSDSSQISLDNQLDANAEQLELARQLLGDPEAASQCTAPAT